MAQRFSGSVFFLEDMKIIGQVFWGFKRERKKKSRKKFGAF